MKNFLLFTFFLTLCICQDSEGKKTKSQPKVIENKSGIIELVKIPAGVVQDGYNNSISKSYWMGKYEITQGEYETVMDTNPSYHIGAKDLPVENVSWKDAIMFCNRLSQMEGLNPCYTIRASGKVECNWENNGYRLPTKLEWEHACYGKLTAQDFFKLMEYAFSDYCWLYENSDKDKYGYIQTMQVGLKLMNGYGLYDMIGNVREYYWNYHGLDDYENETDPRGPASGEYRESRGGNCEDILDVAQTIIVSTYEEQRNTKAGFRVVRLVK